MNKKYILPFFAAFCVCVFSGIQFSVMKLSLMRGLTPIPFLWARFLFAFLSSLVIARFRKLKLSTDKNVIILSIIHPVCAFYLQSLASSLCDVSVISVITATSPVIISLSGFFSKNEKLTVKGWFFITLCAAGGIIAASGSGNTGDFFSPGAAFILSSVILRGIYYTKAKSITGKIPPDELSFSQITYAFICYSILYLLSGEDLVFSGEYISFTEIAGTVYMGIFATTVVYFLNNYLLKILPVSINGGISAVTFVISLISARFINNEELTAGIYTGSVMIIISVILLMREKGKKNITSFK